MKKLIAFLMACALCLSACCALGETDVLTVDEMVAYCDVLLSEAQAAQPVAAQVSETGGYVHDMGAFSVYTQEPSLFSQLLGMELGEDCGLLADMRNITYGDSLETLLAAYPLDNANLAGTADEATLYIRGILPGTVHTGRVVRDKAHVLVAEHVIYTADGENVEKCCVIYTLEDNVVIASLVMLDVQEMTLEEAQAEIDVLAALQEKNEYSVYRTENPEPMAREDLSFGAVDFLTATPESVTALLGAPESDTWENDGKAYMRVMQWNGVQAVFAYSENKTLLNLNVLEVHGDTLEGPRGVRVDDTLESVIARFYHEAESGVLYGDGAAAPYGRCDMHDGGANVTYAAQTDEGTVLLTLSFVGDKLAEITCTWL